MRYQVIIGREGKFPDPETVTVEAPGELDAAFQAGITLALHRPASRLRTLRVKSVASENEAQQAS